MRTTYEV